MCTLLFTIHYGHNMYYYADYGHNADVINCIISTIVLYYLCMHYNIIV